MCKAMEDRLKETDLRATIRIAVRIIKRGKDTLEEISALSGLSIEEVSELAVAISPSEQQIDTADT